MRSSGLLRLKSSGFLAILTLTSHGIVSSCGWRAPGLTNKGQVIEFFENAESQPVPDDSNSEFPLDDGNDPRFPTVEELSGNSDMALENDTRVTGLLEAESKDVDLRSYDTEIRNQGSTSLCTSFATAAALENIANRKYGISIDLSERDLFSHYLRYDTAMALRAASRYWILEEKSWPFAYRRPVAGASSGIAKLSSTSPMMTKASSIIDSLRKNQPVVLGITITTPMLLRGGVINRYGRRANMGHAMLVVGAMFDKKFSKEGGGVLVLKNSWGANAGDHGYAYLPLNYCDARSGFRCWAWAVHDADVKNANPLPAPEIPVVPAEG